MANNRSALQCLYSVYFRLEPDQNIYVITIFTCVLTGILALTGVVANGLVCTAILRNKELQIYSNLLLLLLSLNDFLIASITQPLYIVRRGLESLPLYICWVSLSYRAMWNISIGISFLVVTLISFERCFALFHPFKYKILMTVPRLLSSTLVLEVMWVFFVMLRFLGLSNKIFYSITASLIITCITLITAAHVRIFKLARWHHRQISMTSCSSNEESPKKRKKKQGRRQNYNAREAKIAKSTAFVVGAVFLCYFPLMILLITSNLTPGYEVLYHYYIFPWSDFLVFLNSVLNPLIYCWRSRELRSAIIKIINPGLMKTKIISSPIKSNHQISESFTVKNNVPSNNDGNL